MKKYLLFFPLILLFLLTSCAHTISREMREQASIALTFPEVHADPERYVGEVVIWGGIIIETTNREDGTYIKVLQTPLDRREKPQDAETSQGRFLVKYPRFLDPEIFHEGRKLSVAGEVTGKETLPIGEISYTYPLLLAKELHLWDVEPVVRYPPPFYPPFYFPFYSRPFRSPLFYPPFYWNYWYW